jgi:hypothetical protein
MAEVVEAKLQVLPISPPGNQKIQTVYDCLIVMILLFNFNKLTKINKYSHEYYFVNV